MNGQILKGFLVVFVFAGCAFAQRDLATVLEPVTK